MKTFDKKAMTLAFPTIEDPISSLLEIAMANARPDTEIEHLAWAWNMGLEHNYHLGKLEILYC